MVTPVECTTNRLSFSTSSFPRGELFEPRVILAYVQPVRMLLSEKSGDQYKTNDDTRRYYIIVLVCAHTRRALLPESVTRKIKNASLW